MSQRKGRGGVRARLGRRYGEARAAAKAVDRAAAKNGHIARNSCRKVGQRAISAAKNGAYRRNSRRRAVIPPELTTKNAHIARTRAGNWVRGPFPRRRTGIQHGTRAEIRSVGPFPRRRTGQVSGTRAGNRVEKWVKTGMWFVPKTPGHAKLSFRSHFSSFALVRAISTPIRVKTCQYDVRHMIDLGFYPRRTHKQPALLDHGDLRFSDQKP